jgi:histidine triad (HIT) family protein
MYYHAPNNYSCPFCLLVQGIKNGHVLSTASDIILQNSMVTAFISSHQWPRNHGNVLIIPNQHFENMYELPPELAVDIQQAAQRIALAMKRVYTCDGVSTRQHNEPAGSQDVWHYHLHVTPRYQDDRFYATAAIEKAFMPPEERGWHAAQLRHAITSERHF